MIIEIRAKNCFSFNEPIAFSLEADMRNKKFISNVHIENNFNVLKTAGIYGPNNVGKTCLIRCIRAMRDILLNKRTDLISNIFIKNRICELGTTFLYEGKKFSYDLKFESEKREYLYESFFEIIKDQYGNEKYNCWLKKDTLAEKYECLDESLKKTIPIIAKNNILCHLVDVTKFKHIQEMKKILTQFAGKIDVISANIVNTR